MSPQTNQAVRDKKSGHNNGGEVDISAKMECSTDVATTESTDDPSPHCTPDRTKHPAEHLTFAPHGLERLIVGAFTLPVFSTYWC